MKVKKEKKKKEREMGFVDKSRRFERKKMVVVSMVCYVNGWLLLYLLLILIHFVNWFREGSADKQNQNTQNHIQIFSSHSLSYFKQSIFLKLNKSKNLNLFVKKKKKKNSRIGYKKAGFNAYLQTPAT